MPSFQYLDAKFHPKYNDHIVVLSSNRMPDNISMGSAISGEMYDIANIDSRYPDKFEEAVRVVEEQAKQKKELEEINLRKLVKPESKAAILENTDTDEENKEELKLPSIDQNKSKFESEPSGSENSDEYEGGEGEEEDIAER